MIFSAAAECPISLDGPEESLWAEKWGTSFSVRRCKGTGEAWFDLYIDLESLRRSQLLSYVETPGPGTPVQTTVIEVGSHGDAAHWKSLGGVSVVGIRIYDAQGNVLRQLRREEL